MTQHEREYLFFDIAVPATTLVLIGLIVALVLML
jgi:hypothetical protein